MVTDLQRERELYINGIFNVDEFEFYEVYQGGRTPNSDFKRCQDFEDKGKIRCLCQNGSRHKN